MTAQEIVADLRDKAGYSVDGPEQYHYIFRTFNEDGSVKYPGVKFLQTVHAPTDAVLIHPEVFAALLRGTSFDALVDIYITHE